MNEWRDVLRDAWLKQHPQILNKMHAPDGDCALGVLHLAVHGNKQQAMKCDQGVGLTGVLKELRERFGIGTFLAYEIVKRNDKQGQDFLTIASKAGCRDD